MELQELINKWEEEIAMHIRVVEDPLMWTKEDRLKSSHQAQAICALLADVKKLSIDSVVSSIPTLKDINKLTAGKTVYQTKEYTLYKR